MEITYLIAIGLGLIITLGVLPILIPYLHKIKFGQVEREEGLASHKAKGGTPTMGGVVFVVAPILALLFIDIKAFLDPQMQIVILAYVGYAIIGFIDDFIIVVQKNNNGLSPKVKFMMQSVLAILFYFMYTRTAAATLVIPLFNLTLDLGPLYFLVIFVMFTAESNAVNLTDGLDGLCAGSVMIALAPMILFAIIAQQASLVIFLLAVVGSLIGYLKYNLHPAKIFMGDTGSLALGGLLAASAMILKKELLLIIIGGVFLCEVLSVAIQVIVYKLTKKRVFKMAPLHHHFEMSGFSETQVVIMFWSVGLVLAFVGFFLGVA